MRGRALCLAEGKIQTAAVRGRAGVRGTQPAVPTSWPEDGAPCCWTRIAVRDGTRHVVLLRGRWIADGSPRRAWSQGCTLVPGRPQLCQPPSGPGEGMGTPWTELRRSSGTCELLPPGSQGLRRETPPTTGSATPPFPSSCHSQEGTIRLPER
uniref:CD6 molecule n=1 Tax=Molossus molossus TaxID=27622 RepID=A0A7J8EP74_MOLMO|nr:CD6 molecule [Molossus molossus]